MIEITGIIIAVWSSIGGHHRCGWSPSSQLRRMDFGCRRARTPALSPRLSRGQARAADIEQIIGTPALATPLARQRPVLADLPFPRPRSMRALATRADALVFVISGLIFTAATAEQYRDGAHYPEAGGGSSALRAVRYQNELVPSGRPGAVPKLSIRDRIIGDFFPASHSTSRSSRAALRENGAEDIVSGSGGVNLFLNPAL